MFRYEPASADWLSRWNAGQPDTGRQHKYSSDTRQLVTVNPRSSYNFRLSCPSQTATSRRISAVPSHSIVIHNRQISAFHRSSLVGPRGAKKIHPGGFEPLTSGSVDRRRFACAFTTLHKWRLFRAVNFDLASTTLHQGLITLVCGGISGRNGPITIHEFE